MELRWPKLREELRALLRATPESRNFKRLSEALRGFIQPAEWLRAEDKIQYALKSRQPVHITVCSNNADELYYLPWELLPTGFKGPPLVGVENCLLRYECKDRPVRKPVASTQGRILFAWSDAGGGVPMDGHLDEIRAACAAAQFPFIEEEDVLERVSPRRLAEKLSETARPVTALHLLCHGSKVDDGAYGLVFDPSEEGGEPERVDQWQLASLLFSSRHDSPLRLVTLCACQGGDSGMPAHPLGSIARMFHVQGVPAVIASRMPLTCAGSTTLTKAIYQSLLVQQEDLCTALSSARKKLQREHSSSSDWLSLQFYAPADSPAALTPFSALPAIPTTPAARGDLVLICHESLKQTHVTPTEADAPELFAHRHVRPKILIDQHQAIGERRWENLEPEVARLAATDGVLRTAFAERDTEILYYGFPYVPLAMLAGYLADSRPVHVLEHDRTRQRFTWQTDTVAAHPPLEVVTRHGETGSAARVRVSISNEVRPEDCAQVLPDSDIRLDLHFHLSAPERGVVRREAQLLEYAQTIRQIIDRNIGGKPEFTSIHVFAAVPVSIAFHLGRALAYTGLPECFAYNYNADDAPRYKWCLSLKAAKAADPKQPSITIFPSPSQGSNANHG
ncbi:SAVED domain-containing protein [Corallococcus sp. AS-1-12]|uniref:SAVED domain-containing protein n=1 Tax=Corallococcus sp. AS-1-12 TaxID=2874598 RepID=UPI001CC0A2A0|nr:SAVED domain-containing protein [Corallococcus sp. AS-1-12]